MPPALNPLLYTFELQPPAFAKATADKTANRKPPTGKPELPLIKKEQ